MPVRSHPLHRKWLARRRRLRKWLRPLPRRANVSKYPIIKWFADAARRRPYLWSFKRPQVMASLYAGSVLALLPVYGLQVAIGLALAILVRGNLTVMIALQMITNPLTLGPIYLATHALGEKLIGWTGYGTGPSDVGTHINALVVGGIVAGLGMALVMDLSWRLLAWEARLFRAQLKALHERFEYRHGRHDDGAPRD